MPGAAKKLDFTTLYSVCGDPSSHIAEALATMTPGEKLEVVYKEDDSAVREALKLVVESGVASLESEECQGGRCRAVLVKKV